MNRNNEGRLSKCSSVFLLGKTKAFTEESANAFAFMAGAEGLIRLRCPKSADTTKVVADFDRCTRFCLAVSATGSARQRAPRHAPRTSGQSLYSYKKIWTSQK